MARIVLDRVSKAYPNGHIASRDLELEIADGEFLVLVGPSGCGKSTALRLIAGLETPTSGRVLIGERDVTGLPPQDRDVAMVFQSYALYPHMTVRENLAFGLRIRKMTRDEIDRRVEPVAGILGLATVMDRKPAHLSGGQRQRVALGRALVREPQAFLFDEPLSNLDAKLRIETRAELARLHKRLGATMVYVTHDQEEAMTLGDRVAVLKDGLLQQVAPPMELYRRPVNRFVAGFIGSPAMNFFEGALERSGTGWRFCGRDSSVSLALPAELLPAGEARPDGGTTLGIRPPDVRLDPTGRSSGWPARVSVVEPIGSTQIVHCALDGDDPSALIAVVPAELHLEEDSTVGVEFPPEAIHLFRSEDGARLQARPAE
jgi:multiple sugar transport system ATP-binding protein